MPDGTALPPLGSSYQKPPMSPASSADCNKLSFQRMLSPSASTCLPSPSFSRQNSPALTRADTVELGTRSDPFELGASHYDASMGSLEVIEWDSHKKEFFLPTDSGNVPLDDGQHTVEDLQSDADGAAWVTTAGCLDTKHQGTYEGRVQILHNTLADVKALFKEKFGEEMSDDESAGGDEQFDPLYLMQLSSLEQKLAEVKTAYRNKYSCDPDADKVTTQDEKLEKLEHSLDDVKEMYEQRFGHSVDDMDEDGTVWVTCGKSTAAETHPLDQLEEKLAHVKVLYKKKFGADLHDDAIEGDMSYEEKVQVLDNSLGGLKVLYEQKYGHTVDDIDDDGTVWMTTGVPQPQDEYEQRLHGLQSKLAEVKSLYNEKYSYEDKTKALEDSVNIVKLLFEQKYGCCVDDVDDHGALWMKTEETAEPQDAYSCRLAGLESRLAEVKILYDQKYCHDEKVESLEESLNNVKLVFEQKYGFSIDDEIDDDGALYIQTKGDPELEDDYDSHLADLEMMLAKVKTLYNEKYSYDEKLQVLEASLSDVKGLFEQKYGCDISFMDDDGEKRTCNDAEAAVDPCKGSGDYARRLAGLEDQLSEVEALYFAKYVATEEGEEKGEDGTTWTQTTSRGF